MHCYVIESKEKGHWIENVVFFFLFGANTILASRISWISKRFSVSIDLSDDDTIDIERLHRRNRKQIIFEFAYIYFFFISSEAQRTIYQALHIMWILRSRLLFFEIPDWPLFGHSRILNYHFSEKLNHFNEFPGFSSFLNFRIVYRPQKIFFPLQNFR